MSIHAVLRQGYTDVANGTEAPRERSSQPRMVRRILTTVAFLAVIERHIRIVPNLLGRLVDLGDRAADAGGGKDHVTIALSWPLDLPQDVFCFCGEVRLRTIMQDDCKL